MTIKISQVQTTGGDATLVLTFDNPKGSGNMQSFSLRKSDLYSRLTQLLSLVGRPLTLADAQQVIIQIVNEARVGLAGVPQNFDFAPYIGVELEAL